MPPPPVTELTDQLLADLYDDGSFARGRAYATEDRVQLLVNRPGELRAVCQGSARNTYLVRVRWHDSGNGTYLDDECSCPLGGMCKHCVATVIVAREAAIAELVARTFQPTRGAEHDPAPVPTTWPRPDWRAELLGLDTGVGSASRAEAPPIALQFTVKRPKPNDYRATGPTVSVHPVRRSSTGRWVKNGVSWRELTSPWASQFDSIDPQQRNLLRAISQSTRSSYYTGGASMALDAFQPELWEHLERAQELGIELLGETPGHEVRLEPVRARPHVQVSSDSFGAVTLTVELRAGEVAIDRSEGIPHLLGVPPHGMWIAAERTLRLVPFLAPLHPTVARLLESGPLTVPAHDTDELLDAYLPALARHATVGSPDGSVLIETSRFAGLVLTIERLAPAQLEARWSARYRRGDRVTDHPLHRPPIRSRDPRAEGEAVAALRIDDPDLLVTGFDRKPKDRFLSGPPALSLLLDVVPALEASGQVEIEITGDLPALHAEASTPEIAVVVRDGEAGRDGNDWFDLDVTVLLDGQAIDFPTLFAALHRGDEVLALASGAWVRLDHPELARLRELLEEARGLVDPEGGAAARVNRFQAGWWEELLELGVVAEQSERWAGAVTAMGALRAPEPVPLPEGLHAELRPYQHEGLDWLAFLHANQLGGILADDMGLGKTVQTLALCLRVAEQQPDARFLVVAPTSVVENWAREAARFAPSLRVTTIRETQARRGTPLAEAVAGAQLVVTSYALFRLEVDQYEELPWELLLLDEAQFVKNHQSKAYQCARRLPATTKIAITGTPLENSLMDLWSLLSIAAPGLYPDPKRFSETYRKPIESGEAPELLATLRRRIAPLMRRRTKDAVLTELPPKIEQTIEIELSAKHARIYATQLQRQRQKVLGLVGDVQKHRFEILRSLTILRQLALDPGLVDEANDGVGSAKLDRLVDDLTQVVAEGHRALVFSQFTRFLARVRTRLDDAGIDYAYLDGRTRKRDEAIARFKDGDVPVFVISLKAGGFGLNLTEADYCFVLDPWWNPAAETQAVDRAHRIGQQNPVVVYRYVSADTIEEKVVELKSRKANLFDRVVGEDAELAGALTEDDIRNLLDLG